MPAPLRTAMWSLPRLTARLSRRCRRRSTSRAERYRMGRELRQQVPRRSLGEWSSSASRPDPVQLIIESHQGRLDWLIPVRVGRMTATPYGFLRGAAIVMAADVARLPSTGITPVICGDAHLGNFGFYASPEQDLVIDLNDFDEAHPGGWEWDLRRLVASIWVAGRQNGASEQSANRRCCSAWPGTATRFVIWPLCHCWPGPTSAWTRIACSRARRPSRCGPRSGGRPTRRAAGPATGRCPSSPASATGAVASWRIRR